MKKVKLAGLAAAALLAITPVTGTSYAADANAGQGSGFDLSKVTDVINGITGFFQDIVSKIQGNSDPSKDNTPTNQEAIATQTVNKIGNVTYTNNDAAGALESKLGQITNNGRTLSSAEFARSMWNGWEDGGLPALNIINGDTYKIIKAGDGLKYTLSYPYSTKDDIKDAFANFMNGKGAQVKVTINSKDAKTGEVVNTKEITFTNNTDTVKGADNLNITFKTPINVALNSDTLPIKQSGSANVTADNTKGMAVSVVSADPQAFYETKTDAKNGDNPLDLGNKFTQAGKTYYQPIVIKFNDTVNLQDIANKANNDESAIFNINGNRVIENQVDGNTVKVVREVVVGDKDAEKPTTPDPDTNKNDQKDPDANKDKNPDTDKPKPEDEVGVWKETDQNGIINVNGKIANLMDDDNNLTTRSLAAETQWVTDKYRVNSATGVKQYRVSTHEWVNADDVSFQEKVPDFFTNITQYPEFHTVKLAGPSGFVYAMFNKDGIRSLRGLAGNSAWATDQRATDADGNAYYRVSTDEWVQEGVGVTVN